ncbi:MAG: glucosyltransferase domain-containing protein, partial [Lachnospiraceae bacterium]|nr:glucosyltransferase domain-containing protein [Lachnospiraceae bacterium]
MKIEQKFKELVKSIRPSDWILLVLAFVTFLPFVVQQLNNADDNTYGYLYHIDPGYGVENSMGRFLIRFFDMWRNSIVTPGLVIPLCIVLLTIGAIIICNIFDIKSEFSRVLVGAIIIFAPSVADMLTYYYVADSYCLAFVLMSIAVYMLLRNEGVKNYITGIIIMIMSLSLYQTYVGYALIIITVWAIVMMVSDKITIKFSKGEKESNKETIRIIMAYVGIMAAMVIYLVIYKILNAIGYLGYLKVRRMDSIVSDSMSSLPAKIAGTFRSFIEYFFTDVIIFNGWFGRRYINILVFAAIIAMLVILVVRNKVFHKWYSIVLTALALIVTPIIMCVMSLVAAGASIYAETGILMIPHMNMIYVLMILLADLMITSFGTEKIFGRLTWIASRVVSVVIMLIMIVFIHVFANYIDRQQVQITNLANRLVYRMESLSKYEEGQQVLVVGRPHKGNYSLPDDTYETITKGMIS